MKTISSVAYCNSTDADLREFHSIIMESIVNGGALSEEFSDLFSVNVIEVADGIRGIVNWA